MRNVDGVNKIFVYLPDWGNDYKWWIWNVSRMRLRNYNMGGFAIDENAEYWQTAIKYPEIHSWHELYIKFGVNPLSADVYDYDVWISPEGEFWGGNAHAVAATEILDIYYGVESDDVLCNAESLLIDKGWLKATRSAMWPYYVRDNKDRCWKTTREAYAALLVYCEHHSLQVPTNIRYM